MICLKNVKKKYPGMERYAVKDVSMEIEDGEICVFVGPSGCGKTTTLKMINLLIEPTDGEIYINNQDIQEQNPDKIRQNIGYVIQQTGLFPHMTVYNNIATVPRLLGWNEDEISKRVDELLELVELNPDENRHKYPNALSGGQKQRVGVARAMAANPPILLMDEPFGAVDPIVRTQLQDEFLRLQKRIKKTVCFVTHDIDEAIKMGDKIAIMNNGELVQYDTPENILFNPSNSFVEEFVGHDRSVKVLNLLKVNKVMRTNIITANTSETKEDVLDKLKRRKNLYIIVVDDKSKVIGYINKYELNLSDESWQENIRSFSAMIPANSTLKDAMSEMLQHNISIVPVLNTNNELTGTISMQDIRSYIGKAYGSYEEKLPDIKVSKRRGA